MRNLGFWIFLINLKSQISASLPVNPATRWRAIASIFLGKVPITGDNGIASLFIATSVNNNFRTVSDTKRAFYTMHSRPLNSIYRRFVEELMVEMHLLSVNVDFRYDPIYALGVVTSYDRFMQGYRPEADLTSIFDAICQAVEQDPEKYRQDAQKLQEFAKSLSSENLLAWLSTEINLPESGEFQGVLDAIAANPKFKYSRIFAIGLFSIVEMVNPEMLKDEKQRTPALEKIAAALKLPADKITKDLELYSSNLEKMTQARQVMQDILAADKKKREQREKEKAAATNSANSTHESSAN